MSNPRVLSGNPAASVRNELPTGSDFSHRFDAFCARVTGQTTGFIDDLSGKFHLFVICKVISTMKSIDLLTEDRRIDDAELFR